LGPRDFPGAWVLEFSVWSRRLLAGTQRLQERFALPAQFRFQLVRAIAIAARPCLGAVLVPAIPARVRVLYAQELEIFFPVRLFFRQRRIAKTGFDPGGDAVVIQARFVHVINVLVTGDGTFPKRAVIDRLQQRF
jgi:hypothetical protein